MGRCTAALVVVFISFLWSGVQAFTPNPGVFVSQSTREWNKPLVASPFSASVVENAVSKPGITRTSSTALRSSLAVPAALATKTAIKSAAALVITATAVILERRRSMISNFLYPNSAPELFLSDKGIPLPPGSIGGCPFVGKIRWVNSMNAYLDSVSRKLGSPKIFKFFGLSKPIAVLSGSSTINQVLRKEFNKDNGDGISQVTQFGNLVELFGNQSLSFETESKARYHFMRNLVGQALTDKAVAKGVPALQQAAAESVERVIHPTATGHDDDNKQAVIMEDVCKHLTLEVAWRQIIGLDLKEDEIDEFHEAVNTWIRVFSGSAIYLTFLPKWIVRRTKAYKIKQYLTRKIEERIDFLLENGPDGSTMSAMIFAKNEDDATKRLSRQEVIDNALLLIVAGSETSSLTLSNTMYLLGLHPEAWTKLRQEQEPLVAKNGPALTKEQIDKECPYLDGVVRESMRLLPVSGGGIRVMDDTIVVNGVQIPKKWWAMYSLGLTHANDPMTWKEDGSHMDLKAGFQPDRWMDAKTRPTTEFIPWGAGNRFCVGHILAATEMRIFLAVLARKMTSFDLLTESDTDKCKWKEGIIITPKDGVIISPHATA